MTALRGHETSWEQAAADSPAQARDNDLVWEVMFVYGDAHSALRSVNFAGREVDPLWIRSVLINKQRTGDVRAAETTALVDRCVLCRLPFGEVYDDLVFGRVLVGRNPRNRYYCNVCDTFIRLCPGKASLTLPVLVVDVRGSRSIRKELGDLRAYSRMLATYHRRVAAVIQEHQGFVLNTVGDAIVGVWPSGFVPDDLREMLGWTPDRPAMVSARQAIAAAEALAAIAPAEFDGARLPFRGALDTTEMVIFSVSTGDPGQEDSFAPTGEDEEAASEARRRIGDPVMSAGPSDIGTGAVATDVVGEAIEIATELAGDSTLPAGRLYVTARTDEVAERPLDSEIYRAVGEDGHLARII